MDRGGIKVAVAVAVVVALVLVAEVVASVVMFVGGVPKNAPDGGVLAKTADDGLLENRRLLILLLSVISDGDRPMTGGTLLEG